MKQTRKIFLLHGMEKEVRKVLIVLDRYEATVALERGKYLEEVLKCNKNVAMMSEVVPEEDVENGIIPIFVGESVDENNVIDPKSKYDIGKQFEEIAERYHIDIGDYIPEGEIKQPTKENCILCKIYEDKENSQKKPMDMVIYESENFYVCPAKGALLEGYVMICPKQHILSVAALPIEQRNEFWNVVEDIEHLLKEIYKQDVLMFEHGSGEEGKSKHEKSIVHAHLHVLPTNIRMTEEQMEQISLQPLSYQEIHKFDKVPYFWYIESKENMKIVADPDVYIPRQYARQIIAENLGIQGELWNWRKNDFKGKINDTLMDIAEYLKKNHFRLSSRVRERTTTFLAEMSERNDVL